MVILFISFSPFIFLLTKYLLYASSVVLVFGGVIALKKKKKKTVMILAFMGSFGVINPAVEKAAWWNDSELKFWSQTESESGSVMSDSLQPQGLYNPWNSPGQNTGVGSLALLQGIVPTQGSNAGLSHRRRILYQLRHRESPRMLE